MYPKNNELCASILSDVIRNNNESRMAASSNIQTMKINRNRNQVYALRQKMFGSYVPIMRTWIQSRTASIVDESTEPLRNKAFELRIV